MVNEGKKENKNDTVRGDKSPVKKVHHSLSMTHNNRPATASISKMQTGFNKELAKNNFEASTKAGTFFITSNDSSQPFTKN